MSFKKILAIGSFAILILCLIRISYTESADTRESLLISIILTIASAAFSWIVSAHYSTASSKAENTKLIDRIGEQASEKILNQSKQLYSIEQYLDDKYDKLESENTSSPIKIYLESTRNMIRLIRTSNNTYLSDWAGVVSKKVRKKLFKQSNAQSQLFEDINLIRQSSPDKREKLEEQIVSNAKKLPSHLVPTSILKTNNAEILSHDISENADNRNSGKVTILLGEHSYKGHVVAKFDPHFEVPPANHEERLVRRPNGQKNVALTVNTGTVHDFHVILRSTEHNVPLRPGIYEVEYSFWQTPE